MAKVLISYRRLDAPMAGSLYSALISHYGSELVGIDYTQAEAGADFRSHLLEATSKCEILLVLIGPHWRGINQGEKLSIENDFDPIRQEVAAAFQMRKTIIPILTGGASMPSPEQLPEDIRNLSYQNPARLGTSTFKADVAHLVNVLDARDVIQTATRSSKVSEAQSVARDRLIPSPSRQHMDAVGSVVAFDVFISYPHQEKATADAACARLEAEGIRCWIAPRDIAPSADWAASIVDAIDRCRVMILIFSGHTNRSKQVGREVQQAFDGEKPVVPFRIENVVPAGSFRYYMGSVHWLDALTPPLEEHLERLLVSVRALVKTGASDAEAQSEQMRRDALAHLSEAEQQLDEQGESRKHEVAEQRKEETDARRREEEEARQRAAEEERSKCEADGTLRRIAELESKRTADEARQRTAEKERLEHQAEAEQKRTEAEWERAENANAERRTRKSGGPKSTAGIYLCVLLLAAGAGRLYREFWLNSLFNAVPLPIYPGFFDRHGVAYALVEPWQIFLGVASMLAAVGFLLRLLPAVFVLIASALSFSTDVFILFKGLFGISVVDTNGDTVSSVAGPYYRDWSNRLETFGITTFSLALICCVVFVYFARIVFKKSKG